jgi:5'-deoxynucleotidase YfbR-like HD superfamily hydrolase
MDNKPIARAVINFGQELEKLRVPDPKLSWECGQYEIAETVADRGFRAMHIAYILAHRCLSPKPERAASLLLYPQLDLLIHSDITDASAIHDALRQTLEPLGETADIIFELRDELSQGESPESIVAKDADLLAEALSMLEQSARGRRGIEPRMREIEGSLVSTQAQDLLKEASEVSPFRYHQNFSEATPLLQSEVDYLYELGKLRLQSRTGWEFLGIRHESVGAHSYRGAQLTPFLTQAYAKYHNEHVDSCLTAMHVAVHDIPEARCGDANRVSKAYVSVREKDAINHQTSMPGTAGQKIKEMWLAVEQKRPHEGVIAKDADYTEMVIEADSLVRGKILAAREWITKSLSSLRTPLGMQIVKTLIEEA